MNQKNDHVVIGNMEKRMKKEMLFLMASLLAAGNVFAQDPTYSAATLDEEGELAKQLANPLASLISLPLQYNYDENYGPNDDGSVSRLNIQPVIPFSMNEDWTVITRTIVPLIDQDIPGRSGSGLGDITASQFFSPAKPTESGWTWGAGPAELLPTATDDAIGAEKWGLGPSAVALRQSGRWTYGGLANHIWSVAGDSDRPDISATFLQPFVAYVLPTATTLSLASESTYDWKSEQWSVPANMMVAQMLKLGPQVFQVAGGVRYWIDSPNNGPEGWGFRLQVVLLFPK